MSHCSHLNCLLSDLPSSVNFYWISPGLQTCSGIGHLKIKESQGPRSCRLTGWCGEKEVADEHLSRDTKRVLEAGGRTELRIVLRGEEDRAERAERGEDAGRHSTGTWAVKEKLKDDYQRRWERHFQERKTVSAEAWKKELSQALGRNACWGAETGQIKPKW